MTDMQNTDFNMDAVVASMTRIRAGQTVTGKVVLVGEDEVCVNIGYKADGIIKRSDLTQDDVKVDDEIEAEVKAGRGYPPSALENAAPRFSARLDWRGDLVLEGDANGKGAVTVWLYDLCATRLVRKYESESRDGRFSLTIPSSDWNGDPRLRPAWIQIHQGCHYQGDSWQWPAHEPFKWRWHHRDLLGFYSAKIEVKQ
jgi:hypothetical protein